jgi:multiple antibiotic resistance protein
MGDLLGFGLTAFATLFITIGPIETAAVYAAVTAGIHKPDRKKLALRSVVVATGLLTAFGLLGNQVLALLHVSIPAFRFAGGILLFLEAIALIFGNPHGMSGISSAEKDEALAPGDIAVFPLAFPLIAGPGSLAAIVLLSGRAFDAPRMILVGLSLVSCIAITYCSMRGSESLARLLGITGTDVVGRISGILLAALAAQFTFDGLREAQLFVR